MYSFGRGLVYIYYTYSFGNDVGSIPTKPILSYTKVYEK